MRYQHLHNLSKRRAFWAGLFLGLTGVIVLTVLHALSRRPPLDQKFVQVRPGMTRQEIFAILKPTDAVGTGDIMTWTGAEARLRVFFKDDRAVMTPIERLPPTKFQKLRDLVGL